MVAKNPKITKRVFGYFVSARCSGATQTFPPIREKVQTGGYGFANTKV